MKRLMKKIGKILLLVSICFISLLFSKKLTANAYKYQLSNHYITYNGWGTITTEWYDSDTTKNNSYQRECYWYRPDGTHHKTSTDTGLLTVSPKKTTYSITDAYSYSEGNWSTKFRCKSEYGYWSTHSANGGVYILMNIWISHPSIGTPAAPSSYYTWGDAGCWSKFSTSCTGRGTLSYQWQYYNPNSSAWQNIVDTDFNKSTGINSTNLNLGTGTGGYPLSLNGYQVRCVVTATYKNAKTCQFYNNAYVKDTSSWNTTCSSTSNGAYTYAYAVPSISLTTTNPTGTSVDVVGILSSTDGVSKVAFHTWTLSAEQDDAVWNDASLSGNTATYNVKASEHNNETGMYRTQVYAYTSSNEKAYVGNGSIDYSLGHTFTLDPDYPEDYEIVLLEGAERAGENAIFSIKFEELNSPNGLTYEWHSYDINTDEDVVLSGQNDPVTFGYTGGVQEYEVPYTGYYMLETWGAQGSTVHDGIPGKGGYSGGVVWLEEGTVIYIVVGGTSGYNGGGTGVTGGGATHISTTDRGVLSYFENYKDEVLIVAGGGGGAERTAGGHGGGLVGGSGSDYSGATSTAQGGSQTSGGSHGINNNGTFTGSSGSFGQGGSGAGSDSGGAGGGGWYGGGGVNYAGGGGGGSGYIDGLEKGVTQNGLRDGNGQAKITYISYTVDAENINAEKNGLEFYCVVGQGENFETSNYATLIVNETPLFDELYPEDAITKVMLGDETASDDVLFHLNVLNMGNPPGATYKWYKADAPDALGELLTGQNDIKTFNYTGGMQEYIAPYTGYYQLEVWGAQGGSSMQNGVVYKDSGLGGKGGYSAGIVWLEEGETIYICVGGKGSDGLLEQDAPGGYNGGGSGSWDGGDNETSGGGGGATHVAKSTGVLSMLSSRREDVLIVAGGGGGASWTYPSGVGGGLIGGYTSTTSQLYADQNSGYGFGCGQDGTGTQAENFYDGVAGGGGGWYGGYASTTPKCTSGTGGSGYVGGVKVGSTESGVNSGNGKATITYISYYIPASEITKDMDGLYYYCEVDHVQGKFFSRSAELIVYYAPIINETKPDDATVYAGDDAVFMADVSTPGNPAQYQYQWYVRKGEDAEPEMIAGANGKIYTAENVTTDMDGWTYFCDIIHPCGTQKSREALLTVKVQLPVLLGPNYSHFTEKVVEYDTATFYVEIETPGIPDDYECTWQYRPNAASMWENCEDAWFRTQCNYSQDENGFVMNLSDVPRSLHGYQFRLIVRIANGAYEVITKEATLTVYYDPIYVEPVDLVVIEKSTATFNLEFTDIGNNPEVKVTWFKIDTAGNHNQVKTETITSATTSTYSFTAERTDNGNQYYCVIEPSKTGKMTTGKANLTVCYPPTLDSSKPADMVLEDGKSGNFEVAIAVAGFPDTYTYQWYYATASAPDTWNALSGQTGLTLTVNATKDMNDNRYKCVVSQTYPLDAENNYTSDTTSRVATLTVYYAPVLDAEYPKDVNTVLNKGVSFEVKIATAGNPNEYTYQWFKKANAEAEGIAINGATNTVYSISDVNVTKELNNTYYYCKVYTVSPHASYGHYEVTSRTARLVVYYTPTLNASYPMDKEVNEFGTVSFEVQIATDGNTTNYQYQWYENTKDSSSGGTPIDGAINRVLTLTNVPRTKNNTYYYCVVINEGGEVYSNAAHLTVYYTPIDDKSYPKDITVIEGQSARFEISIATAGNPKEYTYTWEKVSGGETTVIDGATNSSYTISKTTKADNGTKYFCVIGNRAGFIITRQALLTVYYVPELDASYPANTTVVVGNTANFEVKIATKGNPDSYTYQWYVKENASSEGKIINGATNNNYTTEKTTDAMNGYLYYCKVTNDAGTVTSREATLNVLYPVKLDGNYPQDAETYEGKTASFEVKVATHGNPNTYTYQWYRATSSSAIGIAISGANASSYTTPATSSADNNSYYYCEVVNNGGTTASRRAKLTVYYKPILDSAYPQDITVHDGNKATFTVSIATKGNPDTYTYQWFKEDGTKISGATSSSYSVTGTKQLHETKYYCEVTNKAGTVQSRTATLFVKYLPVLDTNYPKDITVVVNNSATFEVVIKEDGNPATYSYQWYENGTAMDGEIASTLTLDTDYVTKAINKNKYYCVVRNEVGTVQSRTATLHVLYPNELNPLYPEDVTVIIGKTATFKVVIEELGTGTPSYQWYSSKTNKNTGGTKIDGATSDTYSVVANAKNMNNTYYYCVVSNDGGSNTSRAAKLTVYYTPVLNTAYPENISVYSGQKATFEVKIATSGNPNSYTYQWYNQNGKINGATSRVYSFVTANSNDKDIYYCKVTNAAGTVTSNSATLRVWWKATLDMEYPKDVEEIEGNNISFEVKIASAGNPSSYKFQWYMADKVGAVGTKISDGTAISYSTIAHRNMDEKYFYCTVTNQH